MKPSYSYNQSLTTAYTDRTEDWQHAYPRPSLRRAVETCRMLSDWQLACVKEADGTRTPLGSIRLPFPPESSLSGICKTLDSGEAWLYETTFTLSDSDRA